MGVSEVQKANLSLDEKLIRFMDQLELLEQKRAALNSLIEQGWFSLTQARYSMGNKQVSALQYASQMEPLVCVHVRNLEDGEVEFCTENSIQKVSEDSTRYVASVEDVGPQEEGVRQRNKPKRDIRETKANEDKGSENIPEGKSIKKRDQTSQQNPLKWFGILVPQPLKQAQMSFKQVIELSAEIAALQIAVLNTRQELKHSLENKQTPREQLSLSSGKGGELNDSALSKQEETKVIPSPESH